MVKVGRTGDRTQIPNIIDSISIREEMNEDCKTCKHNKGCVNIGQFNVNDCLQYEMTIKALNEEIDKLGK